MTAKEAIALIEGQGTVFVSAKGSLPGMAELIANEPIRGSWWA